MEEKLCGFLTGKEINEQVRSILGQEDNKVEAVSCRLHLGDEVYVSGEDCPKYLSENDPHVSLPRGQFALLLTRESINMPKNLFGLISIRMGKKEQGLINISGFHVAPGFKGKLIFSVFNAGPTDVVLRYGDDMFVMFLYRLHHEAPLENTSETHEGQEHLPVHIVTSLKGTSASLADVDKRVGRLEVTIRILELLLIAAAIAVLAVFLRDAFGG
ncbi:dCTP deaminase, dUMP-forming [subsurface metagenome]